MSRTERPYVRVYYVDLERDYPAIYADDAAAALWLRLLVLSEKAWPIDPELPRSAKAGALKRLVVATLVDLMPNHHYQSKGYRKERAEREQKARVGAGERWRQHPPTAPAVAPAPAHPNAPASASPSAMPRTSTSTRTSTKGSSGVTTPRAKPTREPLLTRAQLEDWKTFGREWDGFKSAWLARGFMFPPSGSPEDDDGSQRGLLWSILDRPTDLPRWIAQAPGKSANEVIGHVIRRWHDIRDAAEATEPVVVAHGPNRRQAMEHVGSIMERAVR